MFILKQLLKLLTSTIFFFKIENIVLKKILSNQKLIICYHNVVHNKISKFQLEHNLFVTKEIFQKQIQILKKIILLSNSNEINTKKKLLITFDDGYKESFYNTLNYLNSNEIEPIYFLNMKSIIEEKPIISSLVIYLQKNIKDFDVFCKKNEIKKPAYIHIKPKQLTQFLDSNNIPRLNELVNSYQGMLIKNNDLKILQNKFKFKIGNHLYEHYNSSALDILDYKYFVKKNASEINKNRSKLLAFAFPNGIPFTCFNKKNIDILEDYNYNRVYFSSNSLYKKGIVEDRIVLNQTDNNIQKIKLKIIDGYLKSLYYLYVKRIR